MKPCFAVMAAVFVLALAPPVGHAASQDRACCGDLWGAGRPAPERWGEGASETWRDQRITRHRKVMLDGVPIDYQGARNPYPPTPETVRQGGVLYARECAACHGQRGMGNGDDGRGLSPSPAFLAYLQTRPASIDAFLMWTISEGGAPLDTDMPAFKSELSEEEIWQIVTFMRAGFPAPNP